MSDRERWIVYPLLFFALSLGARDRIMPPSPMECDKLVCRSLSIKSIDDREVIRLNATLEGASIRMYSAAPLSVEDVQLKPRMIQQSVELGANSDGGYTTLFGPKEAPVLKLAHHAEIDASGLAATTSDGRLVKEPQDVAKTWGALTKWEPQETEKNPVEEGDEGAIESGQ